MSATGFTLTNQTYILKSNQTYILKSSLSKLRFNPNSAISYALSFASALPRLWPVIVIESCGSNHVKFLCRNGGRILPQPGDGKLCYAGGGTRVLAVRRSIAFEDLIEKISKLYNSAVLLKCQLPGEDLDALVSVKSDEDLANMLEEYDRVEAREGLCKVREFLFLLPISAGVGKPPVAAKMDGRPSAEAVIVKSVKPQNDSHVAVSVPNHHQISYWCCSALAPNHPVNQILTRGFHANRQHSSRPLARKAGLHVGWAFTLTCDTAVLSGISTR